MYARGAEPSVARQECAVRPETDAQRQSGVQRGRKPPRNAPGGFHGSPRTKGFTYRQITKRENGYRRTSKEGKSHFLYQTRRSGFDRGKDIRIWIDDISFDHVRLTEHSTVEEHSQKAEGVSCAPISANIGAKICKKSSQNLLTR